MPSKSSINPSSVLLPHDRDASSAQQDLNFKLCNAVYKVALISHTNPLPITFLHTHLEQFLLLNPVLYITLPPNSNQRTNMAQSSAGAAGLLARQLKYMQTAKDLPGISCGLVNDNVFEWEVMLMISDDCKYYGGMSPLLISPTIHFILTANVCSSNRR